LTKDHTDQGSSAAEGARERRSAGVVVVRRFDDGWRFLLLRAYRYWDFPKGGIEQGESPLEAALREVKEETGLADLRFRWGDGFVETERYGGDKVARYYLAESPADRVKLGISPALGRPEHHEYRWLAYDAARAPLVPRVAQVLDWAAGVIAGKG
jgi:bis(5'-nucleosidyl)-tetraphosphatase